ncbi:MAG: TIGR00730 family Rossman fold protein [Gammaproteobacteria bacterium]|jgi:hypothetical protein|nr:TIGR00730 family Rossman fold protein [Gammaproteobacteria bacterium]MBQ09228.1 TIGR00730 family Rossman fold protein [Gammaproteobacteria bacterium]MDP6146222.1 TIGR00730 family Rossman fold protein [Gammaproteobacteria bacterium]HJL80330.1 TIGR00730 family Rossman fold protein [Gammaproteobacteria bacterium]HJM09651.1 TIGR00730 family Rossman fold protein [Gammaproteobacteria bacterium]|tara:strand:- start:47183 stop:47785 length:603 start_codon:yes stop_codon:yes gene_type:complete
MSRDPLEIKNVCVFAGSSPGNRKTYSETAKELAQKLTENNYGIVFGGGSNGLMGILADNAIDAKGFITGIITEQLDEIEVGHQGLNELIIVKNMHERKKMMADKSQAVVCLPGGVGTWEEFFESLTWNQLGLQTKPIILLNIGNYYSKLRVFIEHAVKEGFLPQSTSEELVLVNNVDEAIIEIRNFTPKDTSTWYERLKD